MIYEGYQEFVKPRAGLPAGKRYVAETSAYTREEAQRQLDEFAERQRSRGYGADRYWVEEIEPTTDFVIPSWPAPRGLYQVEWTEVPTPGATHWNYQHCRIERQTDGAVYEFERNYPEHKPLEIFRQGERHFALTAPHYTATTVVDLDTGEVIASEASASEGFCPVGYYVPDWHDIHDGPVIPGSHFWSAEDEKPDGSFGFVWGCHWGDDGSWKVQHLDLSMIGQGIIGRDERWGYVELATIGDDPRAYIEYIPGDTDDFVRFAVEKRFRLAGAEL